MALSWSRQDTAAGMSASPDMTDCSGIAASPNFNGIWAILDSGNPASLYWCTETSRGNWTAREIAVTSASNGDWEDVYIVGSTIYIHDNRGTGNPHRLYVVTEPSNPASDTSVSLSATYHWDFPSGGEAENNVNGSSQHPRNCEAIFVWSGKLYGVVKQNIDSGGTAGVYEIGTIGSLSTSSGSPTIGTKVGEIGHPNTGSFSINALGTMVVTTRGAASTGARVWQAGAGSDVTKFLAGNNTQLLSDSITDQVEAGTWWPYNENSFLVVAEDRSTYDYEASEEYKVGVDTLALSATAQDGTVQTIITTIQSWGMLPL